MPRFSPEASSPERQQEEARRKDAYPKLDEIALKLSEDERVQDIVAKYKGSKINAIKELRELFLALPVQSEIENVPKPIPLETAFGLRGGGSNELYLAKRIIELLEDPVDRGSA